MEEQIRISFFRHYTNAKQDEKIIQLLRKEQWQGYGIYWALLEFLTPIKDHKAKCEYDAIAWDLRVDEEIIKRIVENYGLFVVKNGYFWSKSLTSQLDETAENIKRKKAAASRAGKSSAEKRKAANTNSNDSSTDVAENPTSVATDDGSPLINDIHDIHEIDTPYDVSLSNDKETSSSSSSDDATTTKHFDNRVFDNTYLNIVRNYMYKGCRRPTEEATHLIDMFAPAWVTKDGRSFVGREQDACQFWSIPRDRKYIDGPRCTVDECRSVELWLNILQEAHIYDTKVIDDFRGCGYDDKDNKFSLAVPNRDSAMYIEDRHIDALAKVLCRLYGGMVKVEYRIK